MAKYRSKTNTKRTDSATIDAKEEKKFFKVAILITVVLLVLVYLVYSNM